MAIGYMFCYYKAEMSQMHLEAPPQENLSDFYKANGYAIAKGLFSKLECDELIVHYMKMREEGAKGDLGIVNAANGDPLLRYPRLMNMHHWDARTLEWALDRRIQDVLTVLLEDEALFVQTMLYFKPAGARGQALHQDQFYLRANPGTCMAAWMALEPIDEENGCLQVVPRTHELPILCTQTADTQKSFTDVVVPLGEGMEPIPVIMEPGDVLFFNGSLIHGSFPNSSANRFRRSLIGHYITGKSTEVSTYYKPILRADGSEVQLKASEGGGPCGVWVDLDGKSVVELSGGMLSNSLGTE